MKVSSAFIDLSTNVRLLLKSFQQKSACFHTIFIVCNLYYSKNMYYCFNSTSIFTAKNFPYLRDRKKLQICAGEGAEGFCCVCRKPVNPSSHPALVSLSSVTLQCRSLVSL